MTTELTTQTPAAAVILPEADLIDIAKLADVSEALGDVLRTARPMEKTFAVARGIRKLHEMITPAMMEDVKYLAGTSIGFSMDNANYSEEVIKRVIVEALVRGCQLIGNEFTILQGRCYCNKAWTFKQITSWPGVTEFRVKMGDPKRHGESSAIMEATATWKLHGEPNEMSWLKTDDRDERIVVNAYKTSKVDQLKGLGERTVFNKVYEQLLGIANQAADDVIMAETTPEPPAKKAAKNAKKAAKKASTPKAAKIEHQAVAELTDDDGSAQFWDQAKTHLLGLQSPNEILLASEELRTHVDNSTWDDTTKQEINALIMDTVQWQLDQLER